MYDIEDSLSSLLWLNTDFASGRRRDYKDASRLCKDVMRLCKGIMRLCEGQIRRVKAQIELITVFKTIFGFF